MTPPRAMPAGGLFHVGLRAIDRRRLFMDAHDYEAVLRYLERATERYGWIVLAYCLMPNHLHLLVETPESRLDEAMRHVNQSYAQRFNRRRDRIGHVLEARYWSRVLDESYFLAALVYIALNPVRAHLVADAAAWRWSSFAVLAGRAPAPGFVATERMLKLAGSDSAALRKLVDGMADMARAQGAGPVRG